MRRKYHHGSRTITQGDLTITSKLGSVRDTTPVVTITTSYPMEFVCEIIPGKEGDYILEISENGQQDGNVSSHSCRNFQEAMSVVGRRLQMDFVRNEDGLIEDMDRYFTREE